MSQMKVSSLLPWYGAKRSIAKQIVQHIGEHQAYYEPFCGSMAVLLAKPKSRVEVVNDQHADLINLTRVIRDPYLGPLLYRRLRRVLCSEVEFRRAAKLCMEPFVPSQIADFDRAFSYFIGSWLGMNGLAGIDRACSSFARRYSPDGGDPGSRWDSAIRSIPAFRERLRKTSVVSMCGIEMAERIADKEGSVIYCDPPYIEKKDIYLHDFEDEDHERLAEALRKYKHTRVLVSYYEHPKLDELYPGFQKIVLKSRSFMQNPSKKQKPSGNVEVLLLNK